MYTGELTELGGCFLGWQDGPKARLNAQFSAASANVHVIVSANLQVFPTNNSNFCIFYPNVVAIFADFDETSQIFTGVLENDELQYASPKIFRQFTST